MKKPNFFVIGAPRSGTTSLCNYLKQHPDIFISAQKEPLHFCKDFHEESDAYHGYEKCYLDYRKTEDYLNLFEPANTETAVGEGSTWYLYSKRAPKEIYDFNPEAKIVILLRNPIDFLHSLHALFLSSFNEEEKDFAKALTLENERKAGKNVPKGVTFPSRLYYSEVCDFASSIKEYYKYFPKEQVKLIVFDDFKKNTENTYKDLCNYLDVDVSFEPEYRIVNSSKQIRFSGVAKSLKQSFLFDWYQRFIPKGFKKYTRYYIMKVFYEKKERNRLDADKRLELMQQYHPQVAALSKVVGRDLLNLWGYKG